MFRHVACEDILLDNHSIQEILAKGTKPLEKFYKDWSPENFSIQLDKAFEYIYEGSIRKS